MILFQIMTTALEQRLVTVKKFHLASLAVMYLPLSNGGAVPAADNMTHNHRRF